MKAKIDYYELVCIVFQRALSVHESCRQMTGERKNFRKLENAMTYAQTYYKNQLGTTWEKEFEWNQLTDSGIFETKLLKNNRTAVEYKYIITPCCFED